MKKISRHITLDQSLNEAANREKLNVSSLASIAIAQELERLKTNKKGKKP